MKTEQQYHIHLHFGYSPDNIIKKDYNKRVMLCLPDGTIMIKVCLHQIANRDLPLQHPLRNQPVAFIDSGLRHGENS